MYWRDKIPNPVQKGPGCWIFWIKGRGFYKREGEIQGNKDPSQSYGNVKLRKNVPGDVPSTSLPEARYTRRNLGQTRHSGDFSFR